MNTLATSLNREPRAKQSAALLVSVTADADAVLACRVVTTSKLINQIADLGDLPIPRRALNEIAVRVKHEGKISP